MKETKSKYAIYLYPSQMEEIKNLMEQANAKSQSEFVSDAIRFYIGYLQQGKNVDYLAPIIAQAEAETIPSEHLQFLFVKLRKQLDLYKGKKVYGYLPKQIKASVNEIVTHLSSEPAIEELYKEWNKVNREKLSLYYENKDPTAPLVENKEFRSIKNMIIRAVLEMPMDIEIAVSEDTKETEADNPIRIRPLFYEEEPVLKTPTTLDSPPIVISHKESDLPNKMTITKGIIGALARLIGDKCMAHRQTLKGQIDHKLKLQINEKKLAMGLKVETIQKASYQTEEEYEMSM